MHGVKVTIYTDPGCPFGFSAQQQETQLLWHYGGTLDVTRRMIVLREEPASWAESRLSREMVATAAKRLRARYGMPMLTDPPDRLYSTLEASCAYVGARMHDPERAEFLLRALRRRALSEGEPLDSSDTIHRAARVAGIANETVDRWLEDAEVQAALREDMAAARAPLPEALALSHRLSNSDSGLRYSTASAVFEHDQRRIVTPGLQPFAVYEVAIANVAPEVERRPPPQTVEEILAWASYPLATAEVAELRGTGLEEASAELRQAGAHLSPAAADGYWSSALDQEPAAQPSARE
jgi:predicted DsbA family dithiol-disulfide isomerase